jgi:hypothetical protein
MNRWRAFLLHLLLSAVLIGSLAFGLFSLWYPPELLGFAKGDRLFFIIAAIDIVAGPLLTLIVFKPGKPSLKLDLAVVGLLQALFLAAGLWTVWASRPVFLVGGNGYFELVYASQIDTEDLKLAPAGFNHMPAFGARLVGLREPNAQDAEQILASGNFGRPRSTQPLLFQEFEASADALRQRARGVDRLTDFVHFVDLDVLEGFQRELAGKRDAVFLPVASIRGNAVLELDASTMRPLRYLSPRPSQPRGEAQSP